ncbi:hypothetical protein IV203_000605 [Nitzschia inconspicua]|uniref:Uncharacterized protein n=1 Tax=Nitzschia inconspicua TaxID=303405 RepID=A0A9K3PSQ1_9STRA|nr:hypothetical protein IV203_000605 [Nitzschia inconspicua]
MSTEKRSATKRLSSEGTGTGTNSANLEQQQQQQQQQQHVQPISTSAATATTQQPTGGPITTSSNIGRERYTPGATGAEDSTPTVEEAAAEGAYSEETPRQVIAVSASKSPAAFFNLARKFLVTNDMCDLSALEGAIVSAVDAAHLLERSQLATIVRIHTSYVCVEPKRKKPSSPPGQQDVLLIQPSRSSLTELAEGGEVSAASTESDPQPVAAEAVGSASSISASVSNPASVTTSPPSRRGSSGGRELRRARIIVTVRRTESYKRWLEENPLQAIIASEVDEDEEDTMDPTQSTGSPTTS